jgi:hypothetical protein
MSEQQFKIGTTVAFPSGRGRVVDVEQIPEKTLLKILTESGEVRLIPDDIPSLICI